MTYVVNNGGKGGMLEEHNSLRAVAALLTGTARRRVCLMALPINSPIHSSRFLPSHSHSPPSSRATHTPSISTSSCLPSMTLSTFVVSCFCFGCNGVKPDSKRSAYLQPGDIVAVNHGYTGRREGLVVGSHIDHLVRHNTALSRMHVSSKPTRRLFFLGSSSYRGSARLSGRQLLVNPPIFC